MALALTLGFVLVADVLLASTLLRYRGEVVRLRAGMGEAERERTDLILATERHRVRVEIELLRLRSRGDRDLHLAVDVDSGRMILEREGVALREMPVRLAAQSWQGGAGDSAVLVLPRGARTVERILTARDAWDVPEAIFRQRGRSVPASRAIPGVLGRIAAVLSDGTLLYALPDSGVLGDSSIILPGSVRLSAADMRAIAPNLARGMSVYFY